VIRQAEGTAHGEAGGEAGSRGAFSIVFVDSPGWWLFVAIADDIVGKIIVEEAFFPFVQLFVGGESRVV